MIYQRIKYFLKAAETGSITKAAEQLYISQPALAKQIKILEDELGAKLFERTPTGIYLTKFGSFAQEKFSQLSRDFDRTIEDVTQYAKHEKEILNIAFFNALPHDTMVSPVISYLLSSFPEYQINISMMEFEQARLMMLNKKIDMLITNAHEEESWDDLKSLSFGCFETKINVSLVHPWAIKDSITVEDMKKETFLKMQIQGGHYKVPDNEAFYNSIPCKDVYEVDSFQTMLALLSQGTGFAVFPEIFSYRAQSKIKSFEIPGRKFLYHTALIYNPNANIKGIENVVEQLQQNFDLTPIP